MHGQYIVHLQINVCICIDLLAGPHYNSPKFQFYNLDLNFWQIDILPCMHSQQHHNQWRRRSLEDTLCPAARHFLSLQVRYQEPQCTARKNWRPGTGTPAAPCMISCWYHQLIPPLVYLPWNPQNTPGKLKVLN